MIDTPALASPGELADFEDSIDEGAASRWSGLAEDLRFFLLCYFAGLIVFLVMLS